MKTLLPGDHRAGGGCARREYQAVGGASARTQVLTSLHIGKAINAQALPGERAPDDAGVLKQRAMRRARGCSGGIRDSSRARTATLFTCLAYRNTGSDEA